MARNTHVTKSYSTYTDIPSRQGGYDHGLNRYVVETTTTERVHTPAAGYTHFGGSPSKMELLKEYVHSPSMSTRPKYAPKDHHEGYGPNYGPSYDSSSSPHYYGRENHTNRFVNNSQTKVSQPMKTDYFSSPNKYQPSSLGLEGAQYARTGNYSGPNNSWQSAGPPVTSHPITTSTNDINEALGSLKSSLNHLPHSDPSRTQPTDFNRQYQADVFASPTIQPRYFARENTIGSKGPWKRTY